MLIPVWKTILDEPIYPEIAVAHDTIEKIVFCLPNLSLEFISYMACKYR